MFYSQLEGRQAELERRKRERDLESVDCPTCGSQWFEQVEFNRYKNDHSVILGQDIPVRPGNLRYIMLRCACCNKLTEPRVLNNSRDIASGSYDEFLDTLEGKKDLRKEKEAVPEEKPDVPVLSEEL